MGNKVPADLRLVEVTGDMKFDRSILTGENAPVTATVEATDENYLETQNIALLGTHCTNGTGRGVVVATGNNFISFTLFDFGNSFTIVNFIFTYQGIIPCLAGLLSCQLLQIQKLQFFKKK